MHNGEGGGDRLPDKGIMVYDPRLHHRRSIRLRGYDYAGGGAYFVTVCTEARKCLFGEVIEGEMFLNEAGRLVQKTWDSLPERFRSLVLDVFQIMPNHLHGVFVLPGPGLEPALAKATGAPVIQPNEDRRGRACPTLVDGRSVRQGTASRPPTSAGRTSMGDVVGAFKSISTIAVNKLLSRKGTRLLHENFYDRIVRDVAELEIIRDYVIHNPQRWLEDPENPESPTYEDWM
jgi:REP element-mobilizing transposase RayT